MTSAGIQTSPLGDPIVSDFARNDTLSIEVAGQFKLPNGQVHSYSTTLEGDNGFNIDTGEFTYSKLIFRDKNGIGNNTKIKELKYVPVCDKSMKKRKVSRQTNNVQDEWNTAA